MSSSKHENEGLRVIGAGMMRTGTNSLKLALERLLGGKCYHTKEVITYPRHIDMWIKALDAGDMTDEEWKCIFKDFSATLDYPGFPFYAQLMRVYPEAKVILTVREPCSWLKSVQETFVRAQRILTSFPINLITTLTSFSRFGELLRRGNLVTGIDLGDQVAEKRFTDWTEHVKATVPADRLLIFEGNQGWEPLCQFLNVPIPDEPYPNVNFTAEFRDISKLERLGQFAFKFGGPVLISLCAWLIYGICYT